MAEHFDRVVITADGKEYVVLETQVVVDYGQGQGPKGGVVTVNNGWVTVRGFGEARMEAGQDAPGGNSPPGLALVDAQGKRVLVIAAHPGPGGEPPQQAKVYLEGSSATLRCRDANGNEHALLDGAGGNLYLGGKAADGDIVLFASGAPSNLNLAKATIHLDGGSATLRFRDANGNDHALLDGGGGTLYLGGSGREGQLLLFRPDASTRTAKTATAQFAGNDGFLRLGGNGGNAQLLLFDAASQSDVTDLASARIHLDAKSGKAILRAPRLAHPDDFIPTMMDTLVLDSVAGDIVFANADCAEEFEVVDFDAATPGTVMVLDDAGRLCRCTQAYDSKVAGIVSGAGHLKPGIVLGRDSVAGRSRPIALAGRVNCRVDAEYSPVRVGDLLTTSSTPGHAMKVLDERQAFGAVIGKALASLDTGCGLLPILVALQ